MYINYNTTQYKTNIKETILIAKNSEIITDNKASLQSSKSLNKLDNKLKNELAKLPEKIAKIQQKIIELESEKSKLDDITSHDLIHINIEIANQQYQLEKLEDRWLELEYLDSK